MLVQDGGSHRAIKVRNEKEVTPYYLRSYLLNSIAGGGFVLVKRQWDHRNSDLDTGSEVHIEQSRSEMKKR